MSCCRNFPCQIICWLVAFFIWYLIFVGAFLGFVSQQHPACHVAILLVWNLIFVLTISSLLTAGLTHAVPVPEKYRVPDRFLNIALDDRDPTYYKNLYDYSETHPELSYQYLEAFGVVYPRHCDTCQVFKPPRTHHCRSCGKCIPRMDHHCPVIGTCVHFHNHKAFLLFLFWAFVLCFYATGFIGSRLYNILSSLNLRQLDNLPHAVPIMITVSGFTNALVCGIALLVFQWYLWSMLMHNQTSLESREDDTYDLGSKVANIQSIFGKDWRLWPFPIATTTGDGFTFPEKVPNSTTDDEE